MARSSRLFQIFDVGFHEKGDFSYVEKQGTWNVHAKLYRLHFHQPSFEVGEDELTC